MPSTTSLRDIFVSKLHELKGHAHPVRNISEAAETILRIVTEAGADRAACAPLPTELASTLDAHFQDAGLTLLSPPYPHDALPQMIDEAQVGITSADFAIAETGTLVEVCVDDAYRLVSSLPRVHICVLEAGRYVENLQHAVPRLRECLSNHEQNCVVSFISGPSRTGDIEMILTLGVHGPGEVHVVLLEGEGDA